MEWRRPFLRDALWPALLAFLLYLPSLGGPPVWDDHNLLTNNTRVAEMTVRRAFTTDYWEYAKLRNYHGTLHYRPLSILAYSAVLRIFGMDPMPVHFADVLLNAIAVFAFSCLLSGLGLERGICRAGGFLFAVHPLHVEAVSWMSGMSETLAAATILTSLACYVYGKENWSLLFAGCAMLMKETSAAVPAAIFVLAWWRETQRNSSSGESGGALGLDGARGISAWRGAASAVASYLPLLVAYLVIRRLVLPPIAREPASFLADYRFLPAVAGRYLALLFFPWPMSLCYERQGWAIPTLGLGISAAWMVIAWKAKSLRRDLLLAGTLAAVFLFMPITTSPLMALDLEVQDRYAYLATAGACLALAVLLNRLGQRWGAKGFLYLCLAVIPVAATVTLLQERVSSSEEALWANALKIAPSSVRARYQLFVELARQQRPVEAVQVCQEGSRYHPDDGMFRDCLGLSKLSTEELRRVRRTVVGIE